MARREDLGKWLDAVYERGFEYLCSKPAREYILHVWRKDGGPLEVRFVGTMAGAVEVLKAVVLGYDSARRDAQR